MRNGGNTEMFTAWNWSKIKIKVKIELNTNWDIVPIPYRYDILQDIAIKQLPCKTLACVLESNFLLL